jgi:ABC-type uncharacterized transport system substrate-binding protein
MRRRDFITIIDGAAISSGLRPVSVCAQASVARRIGVIGPLAENAGVGGGYPAMIAELRKLGFSGVRDLLVEYRSNEQEARAVFADAAELVRAKVDVLVAIGGELALEAAIAATKTIPIVFGAINYDPIARGYVKSLPRPGGNLTGYVLLQTDLAEKQVELLTQAFPGKTRLAILWDEGSAGQFKAADDRAKALNLNVFGLKLENPPYDFDAAFRALSSNSPDMLLVLSSIFFVPARQRIADLAMQNRLPTMNIFKLYVEVGGLMSYGVDTLEPYRKVATYVAKILRGATPDDLPVEQPTKFEMVVNLKTAKALGIQLPLATLLRADEVIE